MNRLFNKFHKKTGMKIFYLLLMMPKNLPFITAKSGASKIREI